MFDLSCSCVPYVAGFSGLFIFDCPFGILWRLFCRMAHILFTLIVFVCVEWCSTHIVLYFCFVFLRLVYPILPVFLDCLFLSPLRYSLRFIYWKRICACFYFYLYCGWISNYQARIPITDLIPPHLCVCPKRIKTWIFNDLRWEVVVCFVDIGGIVDHPCLAFILIIRSMS